ncbi:DALR anticodon-binding domain-containing protein, partial [Lapillicoccus sp.]|uniref:DALR anticodon-binding domain-containing protein n=1 Tax=Lapillicoccus sp. TaxID=1909287 RepID=UPI0026013F86
MPEDLDAALSAAVRAVLPGSAEVARGHLWHGRPDHWRPDGRGRWSSPVALRVAAAAGMPVAPLATRLAASLGAGLTERLGVAAGRAIEVGEGGFLVVTPGPDDCVAAVAAVLAGGPAYGRPTRPVSPMVVDPTVPQRRTPDNPRFVVMWAHARCCVVLDGVTTDGTAATATPTPIERVLVLLLADLPRAITAAGDDPAGVLRRLLEVAAATHGWLDELPATDRRAPGTRDLAEAARQVLAPGLDVLGL